MDKQRGFCVGLSAPDDIDLSEPGQPLKPGDLISGGTEQLKSQRRRAGAGRLAAGRLRQVLLASRSTKTILRRASAIHIIGDTASPFAKGESPKGSAQGSSLGLDTGSAHS